MYRCQVCREVRGPNKALHRHAILRTLPSGRTEIAKEIPCCASCFGQLEAGVPLKDVRNVPPEVPSVVLEQAKTKSVPVKPLKIAVPVKLFGREIVRQS